MRAPDIEFATTQLYEGFLPQSEAMLKIYERVKAFAYHGQSIMIFGPTGSGKEFVARTYYNHFVNHSPIYKEWETKWEAKYDEIMSDYENVYKDPKERQAFISELKAGVFEAVNCATFDTYLGESQLVGHERGSFTDAYETRPGILETLKFGVLFFDEYGELPFNVQANLLRALDENSRIARRRGGKMEYSTKDMIILAATNRDKSDIRKDLYYRTGKAITLPGIDQRPEDIEVAVPYLIRRAFVKRCDMEKVAGMLRIDGKATKKKILESEKTSALADHLSAMIMQGFLDRSWPGNLRSIRNVVDNSMIMVRHLHSRDAFMDEYIKYCREFILEESLPITSGIIPVANPSYDSGMPAEKPRQQEYLKGRLENIKALSVCNAYELNALSRFLSHHADNTFKKKDLLTYYDNNPHTKSISEGTALDRLNKLIDGGIIEIHEAGKNTHYFLKSDVFSGLINEEVVEYFQLPAVKDKHVMRKEIDTLLIKLKNTDRIYIAGADKTGKTTLVGLLGQKADQKYHLYYRLLKDGGLDELVLLIKELLDKYGVDLPDDEPAELVKSMAIHLDNVFKPLNNNMPVLIQYSGVLWFPHAHSNGDNNDSSFSLI